MRRHELWIGIAIALTSLAAPGAELLVDDPGDGPTVFGCSLRNAMISANLDQAGGGCIAGEGADTITFAPAISGTIEFQLAPPSITGPVTIAGPGMDVLTVDLAGLDHIIIDDGAGSAAAVSIEDLTIRGGSAVGQGGAFLNMEALTLTRVRLEDNFAAQSGGAVASLGGSLTLSDSIVSGNTAGSGGGISIARSSLTLHASQVSGNVASSGNGGGILNERGEVRIDGGSLLNANVAAGYGGGIRSRGLDYGLSIQVDGSTISGNTANDGGGLFNFGGDVRLNDSIVADNTASNTGGGLLAVNTTVYLREGSLVTGNQAISGDGGGLAFDAFNILELDQAEIVDNSAGRHGGAIFGDTRESDKGGVDSPALFLANVTISGNTAGIDGGGIKASQFRLAIEDGLVTGNRALGGDGGAIAQRNDRSTVGTGTFLERLELSDNEAAGRGGALFLAGTNGVRITNATIAENRASDGFAIDSGSPLTLRHLTVVSDGAGANRGGGSSSAVVAEDVSMTNSVMTVPAEGTICRIATIGDDRGNHFEDASCTGVSLGDIGFERLLDLARGFTYFLPEADGPLIDAGSGPDCSAVDQRGAARSIPCDIGALEFFGDLIHLDGFENGSPIEAAGKRGGR